MNIIFPKDLLIIDFESTLGDSEKTEPAQFGAILLDKSTLKEKKVLLKMTCLLYLKKD
jgi:hypothetical protein